MGEKMADLVGQVALRDGEREREADCYLIKAFILS